MKEAKTIVVNATYFKEQWVSEAKNSASCEQDFKEAPNYLIPLCFTATKTTFRITVFKIHLARTQIIVVFMQTLNDMNHSKSN